ENADAAPLVSDAARRLKFAGHERDLLAAGTDHSRKDLLRHGELVGRGPVVDTQQPAGGSLLHGMTQVAGNRLVRSLPRDGQKPPDDLIEHPALAEFCEESMLRDANALPLGLAD